MQGLKTILFSSSDFTIAAASLPEKEMGKEDLSSACEKLVKDETRSTGISPKCNDIIATLLRWSNLV